MKEISAAEVLDMAMQGTTATLLARRWESALLVNVDNATLKRLMDNEDAMKALMNIEGFRSLNSDIETIINKSEHVKSVKKSTDPNQMTPKEKKQLTAEEKEFKSKRKEIQDKLIKFATRIPVFMYLTDFREYCLKDVITQLEPELFRKVTGLTLKDFSLLVSLNVFNSELMNDAVYKFKRYEDASLEYTGINTHKGTRIGGWDTVIDTTQLVDDAQEQDVEETIEPEAEVKPWERLLVNDEVFHKSLGKGIVKALDDKYIIVNFGREDKKFLFPSIFERKFMFVMDSSES